MQTQSEQHPVVRLEQVVRRFTTGAEVGPLTLHASCGEVVALLGPSGCGKSTLLDLICGLQTPDCGLVQCDGAALMPQGDALLPWLDAADNAALPLRLQGVDRRAARERAESTLARLGLRDSSGLRPDQLSGGMRQRVAIARTLLSGAPVLCLDEPFAALDAITREAAQQTLAGVLAEARRTAVLVSHDAQEAALLCDRVYVLDGRGQIATELPGARSADSIDDPQVLAAAHQMRDALKGPVPV